MGLFFRVYKYVIPFGVAFGVSLVIPLEYPIEILGNIYEPTLNVKMLACTPVGAPACTPAYYHGGLLVCVLIDYPYGYSRLPLGGYLCGYVGDTLGVSMGDTLGIPWVYHGILG